MIDLELSRLTRWSLLAAGLLFPVAMAVLLRLVTDPPRAAPLADLSTPVPIICDSARLDASCPGDLHCVASTCKSLRLAARRREGEACTEDLCAVGLECFEGRCFAPERLPVAPDVCRAGPTRAALEYLRSRCAAALGHADSRLTACNAETWEGLSSRDPTFEGHIEALPRKFSLHFPRGEPGPRGRWLTSEIRSYYMQQLAEHHPMLREARAIFVIGRASVEGSYEANRALSERRTAVVAELLQEGLGPAAPPIHAWALASDDALPPERFRASMDAAAVAWDTATVSRIRAMLQTNLAELPGEDWQWLHATINRVVLIVPMYCDGHEYHPATSFQGAVAAPGPTGMGGPTAKEP